ncbi:MAG: arginine N-succinyltransferase [Parvularculaceae bacterium]|nr:arginine N-succinyltransferase [Parvularculaceae bacterium]
MSVAVIRPVRREDFEEVFALAKLSGGGMTNLPNDRGALQARIEFTCESFESGATEPGGEVYMMVLDVDGKVVGTCAVFSAIGLEAGFVNFKIIDEFHYSTRLGRRTRRRVLMPSHDFTATAEVGSLFLSPDARGGRFGKFLARARYLFIAQNPEIVADEVCAELRGWRAPDGSQPFWDSLGRNFFDMEFEDADLHNATYGNQFIQDLMPRHPVYECLLSEAARACIGRPHASAQPAFDMLIDEGFEFDNYIDIFDGGPLVDCRVNRIKTVKESTVFKLAAIADVADAPVTLMAAGAVQSFRCVKEPARIDADRLTVNAQTARALNVKVGDKVRCVAW